MARARAAAVALVAVALVGCTQDPPSTDTTSSTVPVTPDLPTVAVTMTTPDGRVCELCVWRASTAEQRARGLMDVTDLGRVDGMAFTYATPSTGAFWMRSTPLPLTISFHEEGGEQVGLHDMDPCPDEVAPAQCPRYGPTAAYVLALEVPSDRAAELGVVPGSRAALGGPCAPTADEGS